jgi:hypothetical protein
MATTEKQNVSRMTAERVEILTKALQDVQVILNKDIQKQFLTYVNAITGFKSKEFETYVKTFAASLRSEPTPTTKASAKSTTVERITRISPTQATALKRALSMNDEDKKEFDKLKKDFKTYVNGLTDDDFNSKKIELHMQDFAGLQTKGAPPESIPELAVEHIKEVPLDEIKKNRVRFAPLPKSPIAYDIEDGVFVGPSEDDDEYSNEFVLKDTRYAVGEKTKRIYRLGKADEDDVFVGFAGIGDFKEIPIALKHETSDDDVSTLKH